MEVVLYRKLEQFEPELKGYSIHGSRKEKHLWWEEHNTIRLYGPSAQSSSTRIVVLAYYNYTLLNHAHSWLASASIVHNYTLD